MKLRNKKTGEIGELHFKPDKEYHFTVATEDPADMMIFKTLAELNEEWEDYEEPKKYWYIDYDGGIVSWETDNSSTENMMISMGNHFDSLEEAEKTVEKIKAWKRLKDAGFEFKGWKVLDHGSPSIYFNVYRKNSDDIVPFLDLLFGGEE